MASSILPDSFGILIDPYGGIKDLRNKRLVTPLNPDDAFSDDPLDIRAVRFTRNWNLKLIPRFWKDKRQKDRQK